MEFLRLMTNKRAINGSIVPDKWDRLSHDEIFAQRTRADDRAEMKLLYILFK